MLHQKINLYCVIFQVFNSGYFINNFLLKFFNISSSTLSSFNFIKYPYLFSVALFSTSWLRAVKRVVQRWDMLESTYVPQKKVFFCCSSLQADAPARALVGYQEYQLKTQTDAEFNMKSVSRCFPHCVWIYASHRGVAC